MNADAGETSFSGPYTREDGFMGYHEICEELTVPGSRWRDTMDPFQESPYMWNERKWISYDNEQSLRKKSEYSYDFDLAGVMIW
jgi:chitinase